MQVRSKCEIELVFENLSYFKPEVRDAAIGALAGVLNIPREEIKILEVRKGSVKLRVEMPSIALDRLIELYETNSKMTRDLGIIYLTEIFDEIFNIENIRSLLNNEFIYEDLLVICYKNFRISPEQIAPNSIKSEVIEQLLQYVRQQMLVSELLNLLRERKPEAFNKFGSYYKVPRRPARERGKRSHQSNQFTKWQIILAVFLGVGVTLLGVVMLVFVDIFIGSKDQSGITSIIIWLGLYPLGDLAGRVVLKALSGRRGEKSGQLAMISFMLGCVALPIIFFSINFSLSLGEVINADYASSIALLRAIVQLIVRASEFYFSIFKLLISLNGR